MADSETGAKWWLRYIVVPLLGGGSVIAIVVTSITQHQKPRQDTPQQSAVSGSQSPQTGSVQPGSHSDQATESASAVKPTEPLAVDGKSEASASTDFGLYDKESNDRLPGSLFHFPRGTAFYVRWKVKADTLQGTLVLRDSWSDRHQDIPVKNEGSHEFRCNMPETMVNQLLDVTSDGNTLLIRELHVTCD